MVSHTVEIPAVPLELLDTAALTNSLKQTKQPIPLLKDSIKKADEWLHGQFKQDANIRTLILLRACFVDELLRCIWDHFEWQRNDDIALIAVGGYGRGELHPHSDIDLLILLKDENHEHHKSNIEQLITLLWDINLNVGHSVRSLEECIKQAADDVSIATNLMESRLLTGENELFEKMLDATGPEKIWSSRDFFAAKKQEQNQRHLKFNNTEYNLEPNVKSCPGGLRDTQMIGWFAKRHFGVNRLSGLLEAGFLTAEEYDIIKDGTDFLWKVRYALHMITDREEDRLLFEHQRTIAHLFGFKDTEKKLGIEQFMHTYYIWVMALSEINEMLFRLFDETIMRACENETIMELNQRFRICNDYIEVTNEKVFANNPSALLEIFLLMAQNDNIKGVRATTIRLIREYRHLINDAFRADEKNKQIFVELLRAQYHVTTQLKRMKRYGILGLYIPAFGDIIGQMQYDLFHIYTVDAHTILVIMNMRRFFQEDRKEKYPTAAGIVQRLPKIELLYMAGLFHDIAKGRGGDHSELGAVDALAFCLDHGYSRKDSKLVAWLVDKHLTMSSISQKKDISDPEVINEFALLVGDQLHLDYLYALTVADINATNPTLWNSWRASLMRQLYRETKNTLRRGLEKYENRDEWITQTQEAAIAKLATKGFTREHILSVWDNPGDDYFLRETANDIAWHTEAIAANSDKEKPVVLITQLGEDEREGATQIFVSSPDQQDLFAVVASTMDHLNLSIVDARVFASSQGRTLDTFLVLDANGSSLGNDPERLNAIQQQLEIALQDRENYSDIIRKRTPRALQHFKIPTETTIEQDYQNNQTMLEVITPDRPGLLARIGKIFMEHDIALQNARIATLGERVEDVFFITDLNGNPITDETLCEKIQQAVKEQLDAQVTQGNKTITNISI